MMVPFSKDNDQITFRASRRRYAFEWSLLIIQEMFDVEDTRCTRYTPHPLDRRAGTIDRLLDLVGSTSAVCLDLDTNQLGWAGEVNPARPRDALGARFFVSIPWFDRSNAPPLGSKTQGC